MSLIEKKYLLVIAYYLVLLDRGGFKGHTVGFVLLIGLLLIIDIVRTKGFLLIENRAGLWGKALIILGGLVSVCVGIDRGESIFGLFRLIAILVMGLAMQQLDEKDKEFFLSMIPVAGLLSIAGCFLWCLPFFEEWVSMSGRVNGPFGYANTMALFLILGIIILEHNGKRRDRAAQFILMIGLLATGSRTAFVILCGYLIWNFISYKGRDRFILFFFLGVAGLIGVISLAGGNLYAMSRFLKLSINASTLQGRFLYWEDAIRMLIKRPAGLGYMGYFYFQQAEQTGVYSVRFVHNEWIQWVLDYGILAGVGLAIYLYSQCRWDKMPLVDKELLCVISIYSFFDFHLQFFAIILIVLLLIPRGEKVWRCDEGRRKQRGWKYGLLAAIGLSGCMCFSMGMAEYYADRKEYWQAVKWNQFSAQYKQEYLFQSKDLDAAAAYAEKLLQGNQYLYAAYLIKSNAAAQNGQLDDFIVNRRKRLRLRKYEIDEYEDYFGMLFNWYVNACEKKDVQEMEICRSAMRDIPRILSEVKRETSLRAYRIKDKPDLSLDPEYINLFKRVLGVFEIIIADDIEDFS